MTGCDVQYSPGSRDGYEDSDFYGELTYGFRGWKGEQYLNFPGEFDLVAMNTISEDPAENWTFFTARLINTWMGPKKQIDYISISRKFGGSI